MEKRWQPYVYVIGWSHLEKFYVGVRFTKQSYLRDIWETYFTSSRHVKAFRKKHGEPDVVKVIKTFSSREEATNYEGDFIKRHGLIESSNWLNLHSHGSAFINPGGWNHSSEWKKKHSEYMKALPRKRGSENARFGTHLSYETRLKIGAGRKGKLHSDLAKKKMSVAKIGKNNVSSKPIRIQCNDEILQFDTYAEAGRYLNLPANSFSKWIASKKIPKKHGIIILDC